MKKILKKFQKATNYLLKPLGIELVKIYPNERGISVYADVKYYLSKTNVLQCVDVGANIGTYTLLLAELYPDSGILSIEPDENTYEILKNNCKTKANVKTLRTFVGAKKGITSFFINDHPDMSSAFKLGKSGWGTIAKEIKLEVKPLDEIANDFGISYINFLKIDTQGYDFEVLKGAESMLNNQVIDLVAIEHIFSDLYEQNVPLHEVLSFMHTCNYELLAFYQPIYQNNRLGWSDLLFASKNFIQKNN